MALLSTLVKAVAEIEGIDEVQVGWVARYLREAGLLSQAGRGRGAAHMSATDAANLLIGVNASSAPKDAVRAVEVYRELVCTDSIGDISSEDGSIFALGTSFGDSLEMAISLAAEEFGGGSELEWKILIRCNFINPRGISDFDDRFGVLAHNFGSIVRSEITFCRPNSSVILKISETGWTGTDQPPAPPPFDEDEERSRLLMQALYRNSETDYPTSGDRFDRTTISLSTLSRVGGVIRT
ncbi:hypothetical protein [Methylobacterium sp. Leaf123]|uniref:hypothetical protein n=1 Tax=Methylobacterium sp. Leaf123 TaxID=1736264 RepID=UPI000A499E2B|nr:hypothetical protein [Methylobacterium sp. Leaf123]